MSLTDRLLLIYTLASVFQALVVAISLAFIYAQARAASRTVANLEKTIRLNTYLEHKKETESINLLLVNDSELREALGLNKSDLITYILLNHSETAFRLKLEGGVPAEVWESQLLLIKKVMASQLVREHWEKLRREYSSDFVAFVETQLSEHLEVPQVQDDAEQG